MSYETVLQAVSSVGFPIVAYILMWRFARNTMRENTAAIKELQTEIRKLHD